MSTGDDRSQHELGQTQQAEPCAEAAAHYHRGLLYENGWNLERDLAEAARWFRLAADQGDVRAQYALGWAYCEGRGVKQDCARGLDWFRQAAEGGHADAMYRLASMYMNGEGGARDDAEAARWYRKAAKQSEAESFIPLQVTGNGATHVDPSVLLDCPKVRNQLGAFRKMLRRIPAAQRT